MKEDEYKRVIKIEGKNLDDIMRLPCVKSCSKTAILGIYKFGFYAIKMAHPAPFQSAYTGDCLAEDKDGKWYIKREYSSFLKDNK